MPRPYFLSILSPLIFDKDGKKQYDALRFNYSKNIIDGYVNQFFDGFPHLMCENDMAILKSYFEDICLNLKSESITESLEITETETRDKLQAFVTHLAKVGAAELLIPETTYINLKIIISFQLNNVRDSFEPHGYELVWSYVRTLLLQTQTLCEAILNTNSNVYAAINTYINAHFNEWLQAGINHRDREAELAPKTIEASSSAVFEPNQSVVILDTPPIHSNGLGWMSKTLITLGIAAAAGAAWWLTSNQADESASSAHPFKP